MSGGTDVTPYPRSAARRGLEGTVVVALLIDPRGRVRRVRVCESSGHPLLDDAALDGLSTLRTVSPPPVVLRWVTREIRLPIEYRVAGQRAPITPGD